VPQNKIVVQVRAPVLEQLYRAGGAHILVGNVQGGNHVRIKYVVKVPWAAVKRNLRKVLDAARDTIEREWPGHIIVGWHHGAFDAALHREGFPDRFMVALITDRDTESLRAYRHGSKAGIVLIESDSIQVGPPVDVRIAKNVVLSILDHLDSEVVRGCDSLLVGTCSSDPANPWVEINRILRSAWTDNRDGKGFILTPHRWLLAQKLVKKNWPDKCIVGWVASERRDVPALAPWEIRLHRRFFKHPCHVIMLADGETRGVNYFQWKGPFMSRIRSVRTH
jgi:hypothetical protein